MSYLPRLVWNLHSPRLHLQVARIAGVSNMPRPADILIADKQQKKVLLSVCSVQYYPMQSLVILIIKVFFLFI
jgi:hypothetical protein